MLNFTIKMWWDPTCWEQTAVSFFAFSVFNFWESRYH